MRRLASPLLAVLAVVALAAPAGAARRAAPVTILVAANVAEAARRTMPPDLWQRLVYEYANASKVIPFTGSGAPSLDDCHKAGAAYALSADFELTPRLPGMGQDTDRKYATARVALINCITNRPMSERTIRLESDPLSRANEGDFEPNVQVTWMRAVREQLGRQPLELAGVARIVRVEAPFVYIDAAGLNLVQNQIVRVFANKNAQLRPPLEMVVVDVVGKQIQAVYNARETGVVPPQVGEYVEPATPATQKKS